jgi:hypothetical protein
MGNFLKKVRVAVATYFKIYSHLLLERLKKSTERLRPDGHNCDLYLIQVFNR